jgi:hypothetical protein
MTGVTDWREYLMATGQPHPGIDVTSASPPLRLRFAIAVGPSCYERLLTSPGQGSPAAVSDSAKTKVSKFFPLVFLGSGLLSPRIPMETLNLLPCPVDSGS